MLISFCCLGSGVDFASGSFNIMIDAGATEGRGNISVILDDLVEGLETFDVDLTLITSNPRIILGRATAEGQIIDSTGKWMINALMI